LTYHTYGEIFGKEGWSCPAWPLLLVAILLFINLLFGNLIAEAMYECFPSLKIGDVDLDEDLDTYWNSLDEHDRQWSIMEETHFRSFESADFSAYGLPQGKKHFKMLFT